MIIISKINFETPILGIKSHFSFIFYSQKFLLKKNNQKIIIFLKKKNEIREEILIYEEIEL